jgi:hypothetical protein
MALRYPAKGEAGRIRGEEEDEERGRGGLGVPVPVRGYERQAFKKPYTCSSAPAVKCSADSFLTGKPYARLRRVRHRMPATATIKKCLHFYLRLRKRRCLPCLAPFTTDTGCRSSNPLLEPISSSTALQSLVHTRKTHSTSRRSLLHL